MKAAHFYWRLFNCWCLFNHLGLSKLDFAIMSSSRGQLTSLTASESTRASDSDSTSLVSTIASGSTGAGLSSSSGYDHVRKCGKTMGDFFKHTSVVSTEASTSSASTSGSALTSGSASTGALSGSASTSVVSSVLSTSARASTSVGSC